MKQTYFPHSSNSRNDLKLIRMRQKLGWSAYGIFFALLEILFIEKNRLCIDDYDTLSYSLNCDSVVLKQIVEDFDLFIIKDNYFFSKRLETTIEEIHLKSKKASNNAKKRWDNNASAMQVQSERSAIKVNKSILNKSILNQNNILDFKKSIYSIEDISEEDKKEFFLYWSELNKSETKMRWELEKTWNLKGRLNRWCNSSFNNKKDKFPDSFDSWYDKKLDESKRKEYHEHLKSLGWECKYTPTAGQVWNKKK